jgi:hypothetical protein
MLALNSATKPVYRSSGQRGFTRSVIDDGRHVTAQKFEREVRVRFATELCTVQTPEGQVHALAGTMAACAHDCGIDLVSAPGCAAR